MMIIPELEPPSCKKSDTQQAPSLKNNQSNTELSDKGFLPHSGRLAVFGQLAKRLGLIGPQRNAAGWVALVKSFFVGNKYLPHIAIVVLAVLVSASNTYDRVMAQAAKNDLIYIDPGAQYEIVQNIGTYTPLIANGEVLVQKAVLASASSDGFINNIGSVSTEVTQREDPLPDNTSVTVSYTVKGGDTLTTIGWNFSVKLASLKYLNNIDNADAIKPGVSLKIPPKGYEVAPALVAKKEQDKTAKLAMAQRTTITRDSAKSRGSAPASVRALAGSKINGYPYGYCTYYVATKRQVPSSWGDAKQWIGSASRAGYQTGTEPTPGSIVVTSESWWGHVAYVESVNGDEFTISEMNAKGWGVTSQRTLSARDRAVRGFIY